MGKKHYSQSIKDEAVLFYELGHSFAETQVKYGMAESTFFTCGHLPNPAAADIHAVSGGGCAPRIERRDGLLW